MNHLLTPKLDLVFKLLFTKNIAILIDLLNAVLNLPAAQSISQVTVKNPTILPEEITNKFIILDIYAVDNHGDQYDIEMQAQKYPAYPERSVYYLCKLYANQLDAGEFYEQLQPVIGIHFLNYEAFPEYSEFHLCFELRERRHHNLRLTDDFVLHFLELPKLEKDHKIRAKEAPLEEWLSFFNRADQEEGAEMKQRYTNPAIHQAIDVLEQLSADHEVRRLVEVREKALREKNWLLHAARQEGLEEGEVIGKILMLQRVLHRASATREELIQRSHTELEALLASLEAELN